MGFTLRLATAFQKFINGPANQLGHRKTVFVGHLTKRLKLSLPEVVVHALHAPIIHTFGAIAIALLATVSAQELAVPDKPVPVTITSYRVVGFSQEREPDWRFTITYKDSNGKVYTDEHYGPSSVPNPAGGAPLTNPTGADAFLKQLNTANFTTTSLTKRLLQHLVTHGKIPAATVTGTPE